MFDIQIFLGQRNGGSQNKKNGTVNKQDSITHETAHKSGWDPISRINWFMFFVTQLNWKLSKHFVPWIYACDIWAVAEGENANHLGRIRLYMFCGISLPYIVLWPRHRHYILIWQNHKKYSEESRTRINMFTFESGVVLIVGDLVWPVFVPLKAVQCPGCFHRRDTQSAWKCSVSSRA